MPRRTIALLLAGLVISLVCHARADRIPYGSYLSEILGIVEQNYVEPVSEEMLFESAVNGMMKGLDEHSAFVTHESLTDLTESLDQKFVGIGIEVTLDPKTKVLTVLTPTVDTPAFAAGIRPGDHIVAVDGQSTKGYTLQDAIKKMRGPAGEPVVLRIERGGVADPFDVKLVRADIPVESVRGERRRANGTWDYLLTDHPTIGYLRITNFGARTAEEVEQAVKAAVTAGAKSLILDLRENPGGLLDAATGVCEIFVPIGSTIVTTRGRGGVTEDTYHAGESAVEFRGPIAVLVDGDSASASEIVAACLQDTVGAKIVGERSYGKGTVQKMMEVEGGKSMLKLTTSSYWRPSGKNINRLSTSKAEDEWGVSPDAGLDVKLTDDERAKWHELRRRRDILPANAGEERPDFLQPDADENGKFDPQLTKAIEVLSDQKPASP